jgi:hypothetical protein
MMPKGSIKRSLNSLHSFPPRIVLLHFVMNVHTRRYDPDNLFRLDQNIAAKAAA